MIIPTTFRVVVKQQKLEESREEYKRALALNLVIPENDDKKRAQGGVDKGVVVALGPTVFQDFKTDAPIKVGDLIAFAKYSGKVITDPDDNEEYVVLNDEDVVAVIKES